jgi:hypothetical protein
MGEELVRERGDFNGQVVFGFFKPTIEASLPTASWFGMRPDIYSINTVLTDDDGHLWYILRFHDHAYSPVFRLRTNGYGGALYSEFDGVERGYVGPVHHRVEGDAHVIESTQTVPGKQPYRNVRRVDRMEWSEGDLFALTGEASAEVMSFVSPNAKGGWGWTSNIFRLEGTVMGRRVRGFCEWGTGWAGPGTTFMEHYDAAVLHWHFVCNQYTDGTYDLCHIGFMRNETRFVMIANETGPVLASRDLKLEVELDEGGNLARYPREIRLELGGEKWIWRHADDRQAKHPPVTGRASREGYAQRVGDTRKLDFGWGWLNTSGGPLIDPYVINKR